VIVTIDTDGQHDPADIPRLVAPIFSGEADMVNDSRYINLVIARSSKVP